MDQNFILLNIQLLSILLLFTIMGLALYRSGSLKDKRWFIILYATPPILSIFAINPNTALLIPILILTINILYLFRFSKKPLTIVEIKSWKKIFKRS